MASERPGHTLQATALVHEAYLRLSGSTGRAWENRAHFFAAAAEAMRRILVDSARRKQQHKRGGNPEHVELCEFQIVAPAPDEKLIQVHDALDRLAREDPVKAEIVKLRYFVGLKHQEIADALGINEKTVRRHWEIAKVRLFEIISGPPFPSNADQP
jgi:RNA polymerase sigma factor (TIGR02999 family)